MRIRMTELMEDVPEEMLKEVLETREKVEKHAGRHWIKAAAAAVVILLAGGGIVYGATTYPEFFTRYTLGDNGQIRSKLAVDREAEEGVYESETGDYRMKVEEILSDQTYSKILVSVEALNQESTKIMEAGTVLPVVNLKEYKITSEQEPCEGKRYYLIEIPFGGERCGISYHPLMDGTDIDEEWIDNHRKEILTVEFPLLAKTGTSISITPGSLGEGIEYHSLVLSFMGIRGEASITGQGDFPVPRVTAVMEDGNRICLVKGNMGVTGEGETVLSGSESIGGGFEANKENKTGEMQYEKQFDDLLDLEKVEKVLVNGEELWSR